MIIFILPRKTWEPTTNLFKKKNIYFDTSGAMLIEGFALKERRIENEAYRASHW